jgi:hypothetical protein
LRDGTAPHSKLIFPEIPGALTCGSLHIRSSMPPSFSETLRAINFRGKGRLLNLLCPKSGVKRAQIFGNSMELDLADLIQRQIYQGTFEPRETASVKRYLRPGMTFVDVGANVGYYTALAANLVAGRGGRVVAFEPSPYAFARLKKLRNRTGWTTSPP